MRVITMKSRFMGIFVLSAWLVGMSSAVATTMITHVGDNPYSKFPATGGTGTFTNSNVASQAVVIKDFSSLGDIPIILSTSLSIDGNGTSSLLINERITNHTGIDWTDFHLVFGVIDAGAPFTFAFQNVTNSTGDFSSIVTNPNLVTFSGGTIPNGTTFSIGFNAFVTDTPGLNNLLYGIHEFPSVPEPSSVALLAMGSFGLTGYALRRRFGKKKAVKCSL